MKNTKIMLLAVALIAAGTDRTAHATTQTYMNISVHNNSSSDYNVYFYCIGTKGAPSLPNFVGAAGHAIAETTNGVTVPAKKTISITQVQCTNSIGFTYTQPNLIKAPFSSITLD